MTTKHKSLDMIQGHIEFRDYQKDGIQFWAKRNCGIIADSMGLGKSIQALALLAIAWQKGQLKRAIIACPPSLQGNWAQEIQTMTNFSQVVVPPSPATPKKRLEAIEYFAETNADILIVAYTQIEKHMDELIDFRFDFMLLDEAHVLKNPTAKSTKSAHILAGQIPRVFPITGTPMLNWPDEFWSYLFMCKAHLIEDIDGTLSFPEVIKYWSFRRRFVKTVGEYNTPVAVRNEGRLQAILDNFMLRRRKEDVAKDLPEKVHIPVWVDLHPKQRKMYDQAQRDLLVKVNDSEDGVLSIDTAMTLQMRLLQICSTTATLIDEDHSAKLDAAIYTAQQILEQQNEWVIIFTQFKATHAAIQRRLAKLKTVSEEDIFALSGDTPGGQRQPTVNAWTNHHKPAAMVGMLQVAGVGLNMTKASKVIFVDKLFVPGLNTQAEDRAHRIGATAESVEIYDILCRGTVEEDKEAILDRKSAVADAVMPPAEFKKKLMDAIIARAREEMS